MPQIWEIFILSRAKGTDKSGGHVHQIVVECRAFELMVVDVYESTNSFLSNVLDASEEGVALHWRVEGVEGCVAPYIGVEYHLHPLTFLSPHHVGESLVHQPPLEEQVLHHSPKSNCPLS